MVVDKKEKKYEQKQWVRCTTEQEYFGDERKSRKLERKIAVAKDRSKYKKTDRDKISREQCSEEEEKLERFVGSHFLDGRVIASTSEGFIVEHKGEKFSCILRGALKKERKLVKNLVAVGDFVVFESTSLHEGVIAHVKPRKSVLSRADNLSRRKEQLIATNVDQLIITGSVLAPSLKAALLDRYVIAAHKGGLKPLIIINKVDLLSAEEFDAALRQKEEELSAHLVATYNKAGIRAIAVSIKTGEGIEELCSAMKNLSSVFSGQSGVGKSSLINLVTGMDLKTGDVVSKTSKGAHTTTSAQFVPLSFGGWCVDTPGIKSFGVWDLKKEEVEGYFTEIHAEGRLCYFSNCTHLQEKGCAVIKAVEDERISLVRYNSYHALLESVSQEHLRR